jgi:hypothetical protein
MTNDDDTLRVMGPTVFCLLLSKHSLICVVSFVIDQHYSLLDTPQVSVRMDPSE